MFFQQNQDFLKSFGAEVQQPQQLQNLGQASKIQLPPLSSASKKNSKFQVVMQKSQVNQSQKQSQSQNQPVAQLSTSKRLNIITTSHKSRRFSEQCNQIKIKNFKKQQQNDVKSEKSLDADDIQNVVNQNNPDKSNKSISSKSYKFNITQFQGSLMKKIRNLQARIKNMDLNYKNIIMKLKHQNTKLLKERDHYKNFLTTKYPKLAEQVKIIIEKQQEDSDQMFSSSSDSDKQNDQIMPIMSKIQEIRFDGQKMSQMIKNYQQIQIKKQQIIDSLLKQKQKLKQKKQQSEAGESKRKFISRKYSIPEGHRQKKSSYQSTMTTELKQKITENPKQQGMNDNCKSPLPTLNANI